MGFTLQFLLGLGLVLLLSLTCAENYRLTRQTDQHKHEHQTENVIDAIETKTKIPIKDTGKKPKTETKTDANLQKILSAEVTTVRDSIEASSEETPHSGEVRAEDSTESENGSHEDKTFDIKKYLSKEFHSINNVYTLSLSPDTEKYVKGEFDHYASSTYSMPKFSDEAYQFSAEFTTPKNSRTFDDNFKEAVHHIDQQLEHLDNNFDESNESKEEHDEVNLDQLYDSTKDNKTKTELNYLKFNQIVDNQTNNKNNIHKDLVVEEVRNLEYRSSFNDTKLLYGEYPEENDENRSSSIENESTETMENTSQEDRLEFSTPKILIPTTKKNVITKPTPNLNNTHNSLLSNRIEVENRKPIDHVRLNSNPVPVSVSPDKTTERTTTTLGTTAKAPVQIVRTTGLSDVTTTTTEYTTQEMLTTEKTVLPSQTTTTTKIPTTTTRTILTTPKDNSKETTTTTMNTTKNLPVNITKRGSIKYSDTRTTTTAPPPTMPKSKNKHKDENKINETTEQYIQENQIIPQQDVKISHPIDQLAVETITKNLTTTIVTTTQIPVKTTVATTETTTLITTEIPTTTTELTTTTLLSTTITIPTDTTTISTITTTTTNPSPTASHLTTQKMGPVSASALTTTTESVHTTFPSDETTVDMVTTDVEILSSTQMTTEAQLSTTFSTTTIEPTTNMETTRYYDTTTDGSVESTTENKPRSSKSIDLNGTSTVAPLLTTIPSVSSSGGSSSTTIPTNTSSISLTEPQSTTTMTKIDDLEPDYTDPDDDDDEEKKMATTIDTLFEHEGLNNRTSSVHDVFRHNNLDMDDSTHPTESDELVNPPDDDNSGTIAAITISSIGALCLIVLAGLLFVMKKRQKKFNYGQRCRPVNLDDYSVDNVSVYNSVRRKHPNRDSKRSYGNPAFEDPNSITHPLNFPALVRFATIYEDMKAEFDEIPQITARTNELPDGCDAKNRYANVIPLPETRVHLTPIDDYQNSDYINANYVTGPNNVKGYYIACQAPLQNTVDDFWKMIWEQQCKVILMLTHLFENGVEKCVDYIPPSEVTDCNRLFGDYQVTLKKREVKDKYIISSLQLKNMVTNSWREVTHLWYLGWPDRGVPTEANSLIAYLIEARSYMKTRSLDKKDARLNGNLANGLNRNELNPVVVHCSPGTGRTGTVIACDIAIRDFEQNRLVDIPRIVYRIRRDRASSVQTKEQYAFIYKVISLYATKLTGGGLDSL